MRDNTRVQSDRRKINAELVEKILAGNNEAFTELVKEHYAIFFALALRYVHDMGRAEDIVQDGLMTIHKELGTLRNPEQFSSWAYTIIRRKSIRAIKNISRESKVMMQYAENEEIRKIREKSEETINLSHKKETIMKGISQLSNKYREVMVLYYLEELDFKQISKRLFLSRRATDIRLYRARKKLKEILGGIL